MTDKGVIFKSPSGELVEILAVDTGASDGQGHQLYRLAVDSGSSSASAVMIKDNTAATEASVKTVTSVSESDSALVVQAPVLGKTTDAAVITDANGTVQQYLRGLVKLVVAKINVKVADGEDATLGITTGAKVVTDAAGTIQQYLRGLVTLIAARLPVLGQALSAASLPVTLASDQSALAVTPAATESHLGEVGGKLIFVTVEFTRPNDTTAYAANDVVSDNTVTTTVQAMANLARIASGTGYIVKARLSTDKKSVTPRIRVHLFSASDPTVSADNAQWQDKYADASKRLGYFDLPAMTTGADTSNSDMSRTFDLTLRIPAISAANKSIYWVLETLDAFTPAALEKFTLELTMDNN